MAQKIFLVSSFRINADVTVTAYPATTAGNVNFSILEMSSTKPVSPISILSLTSAERSDFYNQVLAFACTLPHGFPSLRPLADAPLPPTEHGLPFRV